MFRSSKLELKGVITLILWVYTLNMQSIPTVSSMQ